MIHLDAICLIFRKKITTIGARWLIILPLLLCIGLKVEAQTRPISGVVRDEQRQAVIGASVTIKGTQTGTTTDEAGQFSINANDGDYIVVSYLGYTEAQYQISSSSSDIQISLIPNNIALEEFVVVGYGVQKKRDVTGAVTSVSEKALREIPVANVQQALQGRAAGLEVQRVGNQPGAGAQIRIRGNRSISGSNEPLIVLNGIPFDGTLNDINPADIASIDILKDASATAIYGSRGANGVILITTKKGVDGETRIIYNGYRGVGTVANAMPVFNAEEYQALRNISTWSGGYLPSEIEGMANGTDTNWQDEMYQSSVRDDHNLTFVGGTPKNSFFIGTGYYRENTVLPGEEFRRYSLNASMDAAVGKRVRVGVSSQNSLSYNDGSQFVSGSPLFRMLAMSPLTTPYNADGSINNQAWGNIDDLNADGRYSPLLLREENPDWIDQVRRFRSFTSVYAEVEILNGLKYRANGGYTFAQQFSGQFRPADTPEKPSFFRAAQGNQARVANAETNGYTFENILQYDKTFNDRHNLSVTGLYSIQEQQTFDNFIQKDSIDENFVKFYNLALSTPITSGNTTIGGGESSWSLVSYMARANYTFDNKYLLTATYRRDGSSRLAPGNQWFDYPALSAGWIATNESFLQDIRHLNVLKFRFGWGQTSNQAINPYQSKGLVNNSNGLGAGSTGGNVIRYNFGPTIVTGYNVVTLPNPNLGWEITSTTNFGIDFGLFRNRIIGSLELYNSKTDGVLYAVNLPVSSGVAGAFLTNIGSMENRGFELNLTAEILQPKTRDGFAWEVDFNIFRNRNKLLSLSSNVTQDIGSQLFVGESLTAIYDYNKLGIWQLNEAEEAARYGAVPGQLKLEDLSGPDGVPDGIINATYDRKVIGDMDARLQGGLTSRFYYKNFDLSLVFYSRIGGLLVSQVHQPFAAYLTVLDGRRNSVKVDYWTPTNPTNWFPMPAPAISTASDAWSTLGYYDATFVKLRSINLGYTFSRAALARIGVENLKLYFVIDNVATLFSPYFNQTGFDPEGTGLGNQGVSNPGNIRNNNNGNGILTVGLGTPLRRTFALGVNITL